MPVETAADRANFFNSDEHAVTATWTLKGGAQSWPVDVILDRPDELAEGGGAIGRRLPAALARCAAEDLPEGYGKGDTLLAAGVAYTIERADLDVTREIATVVLLAP